ncbi:Uncharacterised protein (plasmid) [Legionella adelaidensis]|uniref:Uncharacterized protein n=1 Tax=Legionella adelaidensis TaxID=45056 RepID=A0A0W0R3F6_9GAMM|nr:hypothetical protein [Legionella adelaidensis]KTC65589.1 hypothetical protein Lade_0247 [Legionella adelaidensis]VEH85214.1 Uncharacterised protein [Legionella adelaidensis]
MKTLIASIFACSLAMPLAYADTSTEKQTMATFQTQDGKTVRCMVHPDDKEHFSKIKSGDTVKLMTLCDDELAAGGCNWGNQTLPTVLE